MNSTRGLYHPGHFIAVLPNISLQTSAWQLASRFANTRPCWPHSSLFSIPLFHGELTRRQQEDLEALEHTLGSDFAHATTDQRLLRVHELTWRNHELLWGFEPNPLITRLQASISMELVLPPHECDPEMPLALFPPSIADTDCVSIEAYRVGMIRSLISGTIEADGRLCVRVIASITRK